MKDLTFVEISQIDDDMERNEALYAYFQEDARLQSRVGHVEYATTMAAIQEVLKPGMRILDIGAGTGAYALPLAAAGHSVVAFEPATHNFNLLESKAKELGAQSIEVHRKSSLVMDNLPSGAFDVVLMLGPLYHLSSEEEQKRTLLEGKRVCKADGHLFVAFINHDMVPMTETARNPNWFDGPTYNHDALRLVDRPFVFFTLGECRQLLSSCGYRVLDTIAADGFAELLGPSLEQMSETAYRQYLRWHASRCRREELLGASNHLLFVCKP